MPMKIREAETRKEIFQLKYALSLKHRTYYRTINALYSHILKRSYIERTTNIVLRLEELELNLNAVRYLIRVWFQQSTYQIHTLKSSYDALLYEHALGAWAKEHLHPSIYCLINCGKVTYL